MPLVEIKGLTKKFGALTAVKQVDLQIQAGETLGLVGESGCGKSTLGKTLLRLQEPTSGEIVFNGVDVGHASASDLKGLRRNMQMIFQDPYASLNPRMTVKEIIGEAFAIHKLAYGADREAKIVELVEMVGLRSDHLTRYPHEFSGGQRQRIGIARALAVQPQFIVCDEPLSALDVSVQAQVVNLLKDLQKRLNLTYLFIAHDLSMVEYLSHRVAVMYKGQIVELAQTKELFHNPLHPYTRVLLSAIPIPDPEKERHRVRIPQEPFDLNTPLREVSPGHFVRR